MNDLRRTHEYSPRPVTDIVSEVARETKEFVETRLEMLRAELGDSMKAWKSALPMAGVAAAFVAMASLLLTLALVALVYVALPQGDYRWFFSFLIVGVIWAAIGGLCAYFAARTIRDHPVVPKRTLETLRADKQWIENNRRAA